MCIYADIYMETVTNRDRETEGDRGRQRLILTIIHNDTIAEAGVYGIYKYFKI